MSSKKQPYNNDKSNVKQKPSKITTKNLDISTQQQPHPALLIERAQTAPRLLTSGDILQLQRTIGNQSVGRLFVQRSSQVTVDPKAIVMRALNNQKPEVKEQRLPDSKNTTWEGPNGDKFIYDPFDQTLTVVIPDGRGVQITYTLESDPYDPEIQEAKVTQVVELSPLRVKALGFLDSKQGIDQETKKAKASRIQQDQKTGEERRQKWSQESPANKAAFEQYKAAVAQYTKDVAEYRKDRKKPKPSPPTPPKGMPANPRTTLCNAFPPEMAHAIAGEHGWLALFDPAQSAERQKQDSWRTPETHPDGPKPGDIYSLGGVNKDGTPDGTVKHAGIFKSSRPGPNGTQIWTVVDGGQGTYTHQQILERTRIYNPDTHIFSTKLADAGQKLGDRILRGWIDIDEHFKKNDEP